MYNYKGKILIGKNISGNVEAVFFKLSTRNVNDK